MAAARRPRSRRGTRRRGKQSRPGVAAGSTKRARLLLLGAVVVSAVVLFAWFPAESLLSQRSNLAATETQLSALHKQDAALNQEKQNLSAAAEIGRIAREQYQLVSPGQQAYEVLPPTGATSSGTPYAGDPGSEPPVTPSATPELPPGGVTTTTTPGDGADHHSSRPAASAAAGTGMLERMLHTLEFWR
jgi:cell division protein FtsB